MIRPRGFRGAAFGTAGDGDGRSDEEARRAIASQLGIGTDWAIVRQVHGADVVTARGPGLLGDGDALITTEPGLPLAVATADCLPIVIESDHAVGVVHAGWRGLASGVIGASLEAFSSLDETPIRAAIGPGIGPCCYEVGQEVADRFPGFVRRSDRGEVSVDLVAVARAALGGLEVWSADRCTLTDPGLHSHRRNATTRRQVAIGWLPVG